MIQVKNKPEICKDGCPPMSVFDYCQYIAHAANAYPKLVEALRDALAIMPPESSFLAPTVKLLRDLGEIE